MHSNITHIVQFHSVTQSAKCAVTFYEMTENSIFIAKQIIFLQNGSTS